MSAKCTRQLIAQPGYDFIQAKTFNNEIRSSCKPEKTSSATFLSCRQYQNTFTRYASKCSRVQGKFSDAG